jgi:hypothetical protein
MAIDLPEIWLSLLIKDTLGTISSVLAHSLAFLHATAVDGRKMDALRTEVSYSYVSLVYKW